MSIILSAKPVVQKIKSCLQQDISCLNEKGISTTLGIIRVGSRQDDIAYENSIIKNCQGVGIESKSITLDENIDIKEFIEILDVVNNDPKIQGILVFRPLPKHLDENVIKHIINPDKDIDCMNPLNLAKVFEGDTGGLMPCTPAAVMETLKHYGINLQGSNVVVMGRSLVVGKPLSMMLLKENATVTICHSKTRNLPEVARNANIIIAAMGKARLVDDKYINDKSVVIDVGINDAGEGKICGDVNYEAVHEKVWAITPVPGGIGTVTTAILLKQIVTACKQQMRIKNSENYVIKPMDIIMGC